MSAILVPVMGAFVDFYGHPLRLLLLSAVLIAFSHILIGFTLVTPILPMIGLGLSYSLYGVALWPSVATVAQNQEQVAGFKVKVVGSAYGISTSLLNASLTLFPLISAAIRVGSGNYNLVFGFFCLLSTFGGFACIMAMFVDREGILRRI